MLKRQKTSRLFAFAMLLLMGWMASFFTACAPPAGMIATLTQLPLTPTRTRRPVTATLPPAKTFAPIDNRQETITPGAPGETPGSAEPEQDPSGMESGPTAEAAARPNLPAFQKETGRVLVEGEVVFDVQRDAPGCQLNGVSYSPTYEYFLLVPACAEQINPGFLFRLDGSDRKEITAQGNEIANGHFSWSPDGSQIVYLRHSAESKMKGSSAPPPALLIYHLSRGERVMILDISEDPELHNLAQLRWSPDGNWLAFLNIDPEQAVTEVRLIRSDGSEQQVIDEINEDGSANRLSWQTASGGNFQLDYHTTDGEVIRSYPISPVP